MVRCYLSNYIPKVGTFFTVVASKSKGLSEFDLTVHAYVLSQDLEDFSYKLGRRVTIDYEDNYGENEGIIYAYEKVLALMKSECINYIDAVYSDLNYSTLLPDIRYTEIDNHELKVQYINHTGISGAVKDLSEKAENIEIQAEMTRYIHLPSCRVKEMNQSFA